MLPEAVAPLPPPAWFEHACAELGVEFEGDDLRRLGLFLALLLEANKSVNLTAIRAPDDAWKRHILDAMTLVPLIASVQAEREDSTSPLRLVDVGSGGGVPAIPLAIVMPDVHFTLVESTGKKARFLEHAAALVGATNVKVLSERAERLGRWGNREHREIYDIATARAVGALAILAELLLPLVRVGGIALAVKGEKAEQELTDAAKAIALVGGEPVEISETPTGRIVILSKVSPTARDYPRADAASKPLGVQKPRNR